MLLQPFLVGRKRKMSVASVAYGSGISVEETLHAETVAETDLKSCAIIHSIPQGDAPSILLGAYVLLRSIRSRFDK